MMRTKTGPICSMDCSGIHPTTGTLMASAVPVK